MADKTQNPMREIRIEKVTLNIGAGKDQNKLSKGIKLLTSLTNKQPIKTKTSKRIPGWGLRPGLPIGCKVTVRNEDAQILLKRLLTAVDLLLKESQFDENGNISFGVKECIDIPELKYDPEIGIMGLQVCITLERRGFRVKKRRTRPGVLRQNHKISKLNSIEYMKSQFQVKLPEDE
ncbi:50S ribosomal protein L5 [Candidatus Woesearchaeota archaeon]|mgnify:CR=1 FL=1|jgi:large subunit ribosomal protein L5|nr:50S ribosomal protein L5 [Candidatus Woesearchaeota archaeon]